MVDLYSRISAQRGQRGLAQRGLALPAGPQVGDRQSALLFTSLKNLLRLLSVRFYLFLYFLFCVQMSPHVFCSTEKSAAADVDEIIKVL